MRLYCGGDKSELKHGVRWVGVSRAGRCIAKEAAVFRVQLFTFIAVEFLGASSRIPVAFET